MSAALPGFDYTTWYALYAPLATPAPLVMQINAAVRKALADPGLSAKIEPHGVELLGSAPEEVAVWVQRDTEKWGRIIREAAITVD
jgi:tripartite-type tricarboxylate transporter receptor subunit TctC